MFTVETGYAKTNGRGTQARKQIRFTRVKRCVTQIEHKRVFRALLQSQTAIHRQNLAGNKLRSGREEHHGCGDVPCRPIPLHGRLF